MTKTIWLIVIVAGLGGVLRADGPRPSMLKVSENRRFLVGVDGSPFFYLGDTAWELFHRLNREEAGPLSSIIARF